MDSKEYRTMDKSKWGPGPWQDEPDKMQFEDPVTKLPCLIVRNKTGALCGYVGVPEGHPLYKKDYDDIASRVIEHPHGGLTFSGLCSNAPEEEGICHKPGVGEKDSVWWLGFDCAHLDDFIPQFNEWLDQLKRVLKVDICENGTYKPISYVKAEIAALASELARVGKEGLKG